ncbi:MAG: glycerophosphodiester phosphodiesterase [Alphaproteobacteria bacterium]|nr:glycerophosphodiester phosphodiesterase [Rhizobiaceae bacterium]MBU3962786.1 glycerophosphodiester phosphodiesterase [Alphaproteobacteria bacterium]MBU4051628.1 glycerophosphodiester phosphodiesterase [Alphaproteobacteria bacterium]MBU4090683.1 glycerophosphodiester phosphodiesterase [Alphaproteobacteria bacterium]MBU4156749.1 glycerophosphodiester phosphodiesterase [Alphaproteobacteria bacterium]
MQKSFLARENGAVHICGHRGHSIGAPENTLAAFRANHALGGTSIEIDTVLTADQQIVVIHDLTLERTTNGTGALKDKTAAEVALLDAGSWFSFAFAGERVPTLAETLALAHELDQVLEIEIKEKLHTEAYTQALKTALADPRDLGRVMMISFDHAHLKAVKAAIPGLRTGGIVHERYADPVAIARAANLDELCIDLSVFDPADAEALHAAGISIRCHAYKPEKIAEMEREGLEPVKKLTEYLRAGLLDTISGDDVEWLSELVSRATR